MTDQLIDMAALQRLLNVVGGDPEDLQELLDDFVESVPETIDKMKGASQSGDLAALRIAAHSLKSNARDFGATNLASLCEALEHSCREGTVENPIAAVERIETEEEAVRAALAALRAEDV